MKNLHFLKSGLQKKIKPNPIIILLTLSDIFAWGGFFVVTFLVGLFLAEQLDMNAVQITGTGIAIRYLVRAIFQIPIGMVADKFKKDFDEVYFLLVGITLMSVAIIFMTMVSSPIQYYFLEFVIGLGAALNLVNWRKLFAKNLTEGREGMDYAAYDTAISLSIAAFLFIAGYVAN
ncbi:MAG TPA: MFS transporter, partial [Candidatus Dojkabacteria bacterium]